MRVCMGEYGIIEHGKKWENKEYMLTCDICRDTI
ncbi:hypothetical protein SAMN05216405_3558 [Lachnospiraceae bacterium NLAE-zl-G231]|nr:hypothetical protein SAMN05216405_3558 [Lachnospiraceae bacterium NLAE-zl-G231]